MDLEQLGLAYSSSRPFTKNKERIQKFKQTGDSRYIYQNKLDRACFQHDLAYGDFKDLTIRIASNKILLDKAFNTAKNPKPHGYQRGLASIVYIYFDKKTSGGAIKNENICNKELLQELHKPIVRKSKKKKVHSSFIDKMWGADLTDMELINKFNKESRFYYVLLIFSVNMHVLFLWKIKKVLELRMRLEKFLKNLIVNEKSMGR